jgi:IMP cyclohydrolase
MKNPNGPYPGRQIFVGKTSKGKPAFAYLVTGRSPASRERLATPKGNAVIMGPLGNGPYDPLRHYTAIKYDNVIGLAAISNGIQTDAVFEMYKLLYHVTSAPDKSYMDKIMDGANFEPDTLQTPRISAVVMNPPRETEPIFLLSIKTAGRPAFTWQVKPKAGTLAGLAVYRGDVENPAAFDIEGGLPQVEFKGETPQELADFIYEISSAAHRGEDIRVCSAGGIREGNTWELAMINRHKK